MGAYEAAAASVWAQSAPGSFWETAFRVADDI